MTAARQTSRAGSQRHTVCINAWAPLGATGRIASAAQPCGLVRVYHTTVAAAATLQPCVHRSTCRARREEWSEGTGCRHPHLTLKCILLLLDTPCSFHCKGSCDSINVV